MESNSKTIKNFSAEESYERCLLCQHCEEVHASIPEANHCLKSHNFFRCFGCFEIVKNCKVEVSSHHLQEHHDPAFPTMIRCPFCLVPQSQYMNSLERHVIQVHFNNRNQNVITNNIYNLKKGPRGISRKGYETSKILKLKPCLRRQCCTIAEQLRRDKNKNKKTVEFIETCDVFSYKEDSKVSKAKKIQMDTKILSLLSVKKREDWRDSRKQMTVQERIRIFRIRDVPENIIIKESTQVPHEGLADTTETIVRPVQISSLSQKNTIFPFESDLQVNEPQMPFVPVKKRPLRKENSTIDFIQTKTFLDHNVSKMLSKTPLNILSKPIRPGFLGPPYFVCDACGIPYSKVVRLKKHLDGYFAKCKYVCKLCPIYRRGFNRLHQLPEHEAKYQGFSSSFAFKAAVNDYLIRKRLR